MNLDLSQKNALVCGGSKGIGKATAIELAQLGANVTLFARDAQTLEQTLSELPKRSGQHHYYHIVDFADQAALRQTIQKIVAANPVHILVNNTGGPPGGSILEAQPDAFLQAFNNHVICNQLLVQVVVKGMQKSGYGRIINIISTSVKQPIPGLGVSNTTRAAVANWAKTLAGELGPHGITVNNVLPGYTATGRLRSICEARAQRNETTADIEAEKMRENVPMGRFAKPEEIGAAAAFLASPAAAYITGTNVVVDGGRTGSL